MLREYKLGVQGTLDLPIKLFWFLVNQLERLKAEEGKDGLDVLVAAQSGEAYTQYQTASKKIIGKIYTWDRDTPRVYDADENGLDPDFDKEGLLALKLMTF